MKDNKNNIIVSVIVPVYNVEKYLDRCLISIVNQTLKNIEIILVDDGSKDTSGKLCDEWQKKDKRIKVIHKENEGLGFARNSGINIANGKYICYIDSDDYIKLDTLEKVLSRLEKTNSDICYFGFIEKIGEKEKIVEIPKKLYYSQKEKEEFIKNILGPKEDAKESVFCGVSACTAILKKEVLDKNGIRFLSERKILSEDIIYNLQVCERVNSISIEPNYYYYYCHNNNNSLTTRYRKDRFQAAINMFKEVQKNVNIEDEEVLKRIQRSFMRSLINSVRQEIIYEKINGYELMYNNLKQICNNEIVKKVVTSYPINKMPIKQRILFNLIKYKKIYFLIIVIKLKLKSEGK